MSWLGENLGFEKFQLKDWFKKIKSNPEQLVLGAGDPLSAKMWGGITGKKYEPFVDQMGGPYGGHVVSAFGNNDGGVYGRAEDAGINTKPATQMHDTAHVISALFAGNYLNSQIPGSGESGGGSNWQQYAQTGGQNEQPSTPTVDTQEGEQKRQLAEALANQATSMMSSSAMTPGITSLPPQFVPTTQFAQRYPLGGYFGVGSTYPRRG